MTTLDGPAPDTDLPGTTDVRTTSVDGVPVLWCEAPGPLRACLLVRAGWADETLPTRGWSHLVEHLALAGIGRPGDHSNGQTDATTTAYQIEGEPEQVVDFLDLVSSRLADLPTTRLADEVGVLRAEQDGRGGSVFDQLLSWRYGALDYGLGGLNELGLSVTPDAEALRHRARTQAVTGNAVVWLSGPPPAGMRLHLPDGPFQPPPDPRRTVAGDLPAWIVGSDQQVAGVSVIRRGWQAQALRHISAARLLDVLRSELAVAYSPGAGYSPLTADAGWLTLRSDLVPGRQSEGVGPFLRLLEQLAGDEGAPGALTEADLEDFHADARRRTADPYAWASELVGRASDVLLHRDEQRGLPTDVTLDEVREAAREAAASLLVALPRGLGTYRDGWSQALDSTVERVHGVEHREYGSDQVLVRAPEGVSVVRGGNAATVRLDRAAGVLRWPDGRRTLIGEDAVQVTIEPTMFEGGADLVRHVDQTFPPHLVVPMAPRVPGAVPRPTATDLAPAPGSTSTGPLGEGFDRFARAHRWPALVLMLLGALVAAAVLLLLVVAADGPAAIVAPVTGLGLYTVVRTWRTRYPATPR